MNRQNAIRLITEQVKDEIIVSANGFLSRDLFHLFDKQSNFYMLGSMGLASSIGLGLAIKNTKKRIFVFDGDGNILMNLGSLTTIGSLKPKNLIHFIFDNNSHESTGGQPTNTNKIKIEKIGKVVGYNVFRVENEIQLGSILRKIQTLIGPIIIIIKIEKNNTVSGRVSRKPLDIKKRFMNSILKIN